MKVIDSCYKYSRAGDASSRVRDKYVNSQKAEIALCVFSPFFKRFTQFTLRIQTNGVSLYIIQARKSFSLCWFKEDRGRRGPLIMLLQV